MNSSAITTRAFVAADQERFARLSGDANPMHMDPVAARRTQAGAPVVHGMHAALWALDALIEAGCVPAPVATVKAQFQRFVYVGDEVTLNLTRRSDAALRATLAVGDLAAATLTITFGAPAAEPVEPVCADAAPASVSSPAELDLADLPGRAGWLAPAAEGPLVAAFGHACTRLGAARVGALARLSALVGTVCPGLHSIFSAFDVRMADLGGAAGLSFRVLDVDERFRRAEIAVAGGGIAGAVTAFVRHPPVGQPGLAEVSRLVEPGEFAGTVALVVGGSRGLGALTARALVAGGGRVVITYAVGEADAREVAAELGADACRVLRYDAREDAAPQLAGLEWGVTQLYYFATTRIFRQKVGLYNPALFAEFCRIYVDGFHAACTALQARAGAPLAAFYPSSVAVEDRPRDMTEYGMAKAAGEMLCADLNRFSRGLRVVVSRLPRLLTDQTATVTPVQSGDAMEAMLPAIRRMHERAAPPPGPTPA